MSILCSGAGSAVLGREAAMACTVAVEETVVDHYNRSDQGLMCVHLHS